MCSCDSDDDAMAVNREKKKELGEERTSRGGTERETRKNKSKKMTSIREAAVCVDALDSSRVHMCNGRAAARLYNTP